MKSCTIWHLEATVAFHEVLENADSMCYCLWIVNDQASKGRYIHHIRDPWGPPIPSCAVGTGFGACAWRSFKIQP